MVKNLVVSFLKNFNNLKLKLNHHNYNFIKINPASCYFKNPIKYTTSTIYLLTSCAAFTLYYFNTTEKWTPVQISHALSLFPTVSSSKHTNATTSSLQNSSTITLKSAMEYSDRKEKDVEKAYENLMLFEKDADTNFELCWRLARACIQYSSKIDLDADLTKSLSEKAIEYAKKALTINPWSAIAHLWMGIALSNANSYESYFNRILNAPIIKGHFERAIEFNPADPYAHHMLAMWHFTVADYSFMAKLIALLAFGGGPVMTSFHEALMKFEDAERIQPNFSIKNHLMLGKTNVRIGNYSAARKWLDHCLKMPTTCHEDSQIKEDAMFIIEYLDQINPI